MKSALLLEIKGRVLKCLSARCLSFYFLWDLAGKIVVLGIIVFECQILSTSSSSHYDFYLLTKHFTNLRSQNPSIGVFQSHKIVNPQIG